MSTPITEFYDPVRALLGDNDLPLQYADGIILRGVKTQVQGGQIVDPVTRQVYALDVDLVSITPAVANPNVWMLIGLKTARMFAAHRPSRESARTRAYAESTGDFAGLMWELERQVHEIENGSMFDGWGSLATWIEGFGGVTNVWAHLVRLKVDAPFQSAVLSQSGLSTVNSVN